MSVTVMTDFVRTAHPSDDDARLSRWAAHDAAVAAVLAKLQELLSAAFATEGWPRRITLPAPCTPAEVEAVDAFVTALRTDLPDVTVLIRS